MHTNAFINYAGATELNSKARFPSKCRCSLFRYRLNVLQCCQVFDGEQLDSGESAADAKAREKKRLKDERRAKRAAKAAAQEERRRKHEEAAGTADNSHSNGANPKASKTKKSKKAKKSALNDQPTAAASKDLPDSEEDDDAPFAVDEGVVLDNDGAAGNRVDEDVENDPAYQEFLRQIAIEEEKVDSESASGSGRKKKKKGGR